MTIPLGEKQYELGGVVFGLGCPLEVKEEGWTPGAAELRKSNADRPAGDGVRMGRTRTGSATWGFELFTNAREDGPDPEAAAWDALAALGTAWGADDIRTRAGEIMPLRYKLAGKTRRIYGRPERWTPAPNNLSLSGRIDVVADFATIDHLIYDDELQSKTIPIAPAAVPGGGVIPPFIPPYITGRSASTRQDSITVGGTVPTPITVKFAGPVAGARVEIGDLAATVNPGFIVQLVNDVATNDEVTVDGRPWIRSATNKAGGGVLVKPRVTQISRMWLPPGTHNVYFTGVDPTGNATVEITWRDAARTPR